MDFTKNGETHHFELDLDKICALEEADKEYSFLQEVSDLGENPRLSTLCRIAEVIGSDYKTLTKTYGYTMGDVVDIFIGCMSELGFQSDV